MNISLGRIHRKETQRRSAVASASRQANEPEKKSCQKHSTGSSALRFPADFISRHEFSILISWVWFPWKLYAHKYLWNCCENRKNWREILMFCFLFLNLYGKIIWLGVFRILIRLSFSSREMKLIMWINNLQLNFRLCRLVLVWRSLTVPLVLYDSIRFWFEKLSTED